MKKNIALLYGFSFFDQFMIVIALWVPYLATQGIGMRQFTARTTSSATQPCPLAHTATLT